MRDEALTGTLRRNCGDGLECFSVRERAVLAEMLANASKERLILSQGRSLVLYNAAVRTFVGTNSHAQLASETQAFSHFHTRRYKQGRITVENPKLLPVPRCLLPQTPQIYVP